MKLFADTADLGELEYCFSRGVDDGITTNPKIMEMAGVSNFREACLAILSKYRDVPVSLETDLRGIKVSEVEQRFRDVKRVLLEQAYEIAHMGNNVVVKIPICRGGLMAVEELNRSEIRTNVTACMTPYQALAAADAGATYVSLFANRMLDSNILTMAGISLNVLVENLDWKKTLAEKREEHFDGAWAKTLDEINYVAAQLDGKGSSLIVGSIRGPDDIYRISAAAPQIITIPTKMVRGLDNIPGLKWAGRTLTIRRNVAMGNSLDHPMTQYTLDEFEKAAENYRK